MFAIDVHTSILFLALSNVIIAVFLLVGSSKMRKKHYFNVDVVLFLLYQIINYNIN